MNSEWREIIGRELDREAERIMDEVNSDPTLREVQAPEGMYDEVMKQIQEYERQKSYEQLSEEDLKCLMVGKAYMKRRKVYRHVILAAAVVALFSLGTVSLGEKDGIFGFVTRWFSDDEQVVINSEEVEQILFVDENELFEEVEKVYGFIPVRLGYLPENTELFEATMDEVLQCVNMIYGLEEKASLTYIIRPNYRESSFGMVMEDEKKEEYKIMVNDTEVVLTRYAIDEMEENQWSVYFVYEDVIYMLRIFEMEQEEVEKIVMNLDFPTKGD